MIITVTPNPSIDVALTVAHLEVGEVNRAITVRRDPAGKGVNVSRALSANGVATSAVFPSDSVNGTQLIRLLDAAQVDSHPVPIEQPIRQNITILDDRGTTKVNESGPQLSEAELNALTDAVISNLDTHPRWLVVAGSLPPGLNESWLVTIGKAAQDRKVPFAVDISGDSLAAVVRSGVATVIKPNDDELTELLGHPLKTVGDVVDGVRTILFTPGAHALVSLGSHGALLVTQDASWWAGTAPRTAVSTVGAGDSTLAGYLSINTPDLATRLVTGVAWGAAAVTLPGTVVPTPDVINTDDVNLIINPEPTTVIGELTA